MGRGCPPRPEVIEGHKLEVGSSYLLEALERGAHAASDYYETAALSRVTTVGCRRCGGRPGGGPLFLDGVGGGGGAERPRNPGGAFFGARAGGCRGGGGGGVVPVRGGPGTPIHCG